jgi:tRNA G37 N-methylase Trm5
MTIQRPLTMARTFISSRISEGVQVIDATAGNGHDTLFLARLVGDRGRVFSFDIQQEAIEHTRRLLEAENILERVELIQHGHEEMHLFVHEPVAAVMFNLGYLPRGDHLIVTRPDSTVSAIEASLRILSRGGIITVVLYTGHDGGREEQDAVLKFCKKLDQKHYTVLSYKIINQVNEPPSLLVIESLDFNISGGS